MENLRRSVQYQEKNLLTSIEHVMKYNDGQLVMWGDVVDTGDDVSSTVVVSIDEGIYHPDFPFETYGLFLKKGILVISETGGLMHFLEPCPDLALIHRAQPDIQKIRGFLAPKFYDGQYMSIRAHNTNYPSPIIYKEKEPVVIGDFIKSVDFGFGVVVAVSEALFGPDYLVAEWRGLTGVQVVYENGRLVAYDEPDDDVVLIGRNHPDYVPLRRFMLRRHKIEKLDLSSKQSANYKLFYSDGSEMRIGDRIDRGRGKIDLVVVIPAEGIGSNGFQVEDWCDLCFGYVAETENRLLLPFDELEGDVKLVDRCIT